MSQKHCGQVYDKYLLIKTLKISKIIWRGVFPLPVSPREGEVMVGVVVELIILRPLVTRIELTVVVVVERLQSWQVLGQLVLDTSGRGRGLHS